MADVLAEVEFRSTEGMPYYQGTCKLTDPVEKKSKKHLIVLKTAGTYTLPVAKVAQLCKDFPDNFSTSAKINLDDYETPAATVELSPGEGVPEKFAKPPVENRMAAAPSRNR
jgi:hypothetical protein